MPNNIIRLDNLEALTTLWMAWVSVHTVGVEKKGMLNSKTWRIATEKLQASHVPLLFSQYRWGLFWGEEAAGTLIFEAAIAVQMQS